MTKSGSKSKQGASKKRCLSPDSCSEDLLKLSANAAKKKARKSNMTFSSSDEDEFADLALDRALADFDVGATSKTAAAKQPQLSKRNLAPKVPESGARRTSSLLKLLDNASWKSKPHTKSRSMSSESHTNEAQGIVNSVGASRDADGELEEDQLMDSADEETTKAQSPLFLSKNVDSDFAGFEENDLLLDTGAIEQDPIASFELNGAAPQNDDGTLKPTETEQQSRSASTLLEGDIENNSISEFDTQRSDDANKALDPPEEEEIGEYTQTVKKDDVLAFLRVQRQKKDAAKASNSHKAAPLIHQPLPKSTSFMTEEPTRVTDWVDLDPTLPASCLSAQLEAENQPKQARSKKGCQGSPGHPATEEVAATKTAGEQTSFNHSEPAEVLRPQTVAPDPVLPPGPLDNQDPPAQDVSDAHREGPVFYTRAPEETGDKEGEGDDLMAALEEWLDGNEAADLAAALANGR